MKFGTNLMNAVTMAAFLAVPLLAKAQTVPMPASSINGGRGVIGFTIPALPSDLCTSSNNMCITDASLPGKFDNLIAPTVAQLQQNQGGKPWTTYFLGQTACSPGNYACMNIRGDGLLVFVSGTMLGANPGRLPNVNEVMGTNVTCAGQIGSQRIANWTAYPTGLTTTNYTPTGWAMTYTEETCNTSGGGGNAN